MRKHDLSNQKTVITAKNKIIKYHQMSTKFFKDVSVELACISYNIENKKNMNFSYEKVDKIQQIQALISRKT